MEKYYDVIIIGTGVSGCFTALHLPESYRILMVTKENLDKSNSFLAQGGICVLHDENDRESFIEDTLRAGHYENNRKAVEIMVDTSSSIIEELEAVGIMFHKHNGDYVYTREGAHSKPRILYHEDTTGKEITTKLIKEVQKRKNITLIEQNEWVDILVQDNQCYGTMLRSKEGEVSFVSGVYTVLATGGVGGLFEHSTNYPHIQGDGLKVALQHHIEIENIQYIQFHPTTFYNTSKGRSFLISESVRGEGALLYNKNKERFVDELLARDALTKAIYKQMERDNQPFVWLSMKAIREVDIEVRFPNIVAHCKEQGIDPHKDLIPVVPAQHYSMGGIQINMQGKTSMEHLYAVGETACNGVHGKNRLASNSLLESLVFAKRAAQDISNQKLQFDLKKAEECIENYQPIDEKEVTSRLLQTLQIKE